MARLLILSAIALISVPQLVQAKGYQRVKARDFTGRSYHSRLNKAPAAQAQFSEARQSHRTNAGKRALRAQERELKTLIAERINGAFRSESQQVKAKDIKLKVTPMVYAFQAQAPGYFAWEYKELSKVSFAVETSKSKRSSGSRNYRMAGKVHAVTGPGPLSLPRLADMSLKVRVPGSSTTSFDLNAERQPIF